MSVVVEQTLPFNPQALDLQNPSRWTNLFPLLRPNVKAVQTSKGHNILVNEPLAKSNHVRVAAIGSSGNFSSKLLDDRNVAAIVTEKSGAGLLTASDVHYELRTKLGDHQGVVVVKAGKQGKVDVHGSDFVEVETESELQQDHVLHLLCNAKESCRTSIHQTADLLKGFVGSASTTCSKFHTEKAEGNPAVLHAEGAAGFQKAKGAIERDLQKIVKAQGGLASDAVLSVHYSDINGLSRLENYILAKEIAQYLGRADLLWSFELVMLTVRRVPEHALLALTFDDPESRRARSRLGHLDLSRQEPLPLCTAKTEAGSDLSRCRRQGEQRRPRANQL